MASKAETGGREFDPRVRQFVDTFVANDGAKATERAIQERYGADPEHAGEHKEALAYLRRAYEDQL